MENTEIIKKSLLFPIKYYKHFIIGTLLFLASELIQEYVVHTHSDGNVLLAFIVFIILPLLALGINLQIIFHAIKENKGFPKLSLKKSLDESVKDVLLETYYLILTLVITVIFSALIGLFRNVFDISSYLSKLMITLEESSVIEMIGATPDIVLLNNIDAIAVSLLIFLIVLTVMFTFCTIGKIDLETHHNFRQIFDPRYIFGIIKKIGISKYLKFLILIIVTCIVLANIIYYLDFKQLGSLLSALLEAFTLFFFLHAFALLYPEESK